MSWRSESLLFKLSITPGALTAAQRHCTTPVVMLATRNLRFHLGHLCIIPTVMSRVFFNATQVTVGAWSLFVAADVGHYGVSISFQLSENSLVMVVTGGLCPKTGAPLSPIPSQAMSWNAHIPYSLTME